MAYRVNPASKNRAHQHGRPRRDGALGRNTLIAASAIGVLGIASIGMAMMSGPSHSVPPIDEAAKASSARLVSRTIEPVQTAALAPGQKAASQAPAPGEIFATPTSARGPAASGTSTIAKTEAAPASRIAAVFETIPAEALVARSAFPSAAAKVVVAKADPAEQPRIAPANAIAPVKSVAVRAEKPKPAPTKVAAATSAPADAEAIYLARELFEARLTTGSLGTLTQDAEGEEPAAASDTPPTQRFALAYASPESTRTLEASALDAKTSAPLSPASAKKAAASVAAKPLVAVAPKPARKLTAFEKLYGGPVRVASLGPVDFTRADFDGKLPRAPYDRKTAVYVITEKKVYLPDGAELEAHSGLGRKMDDPAHVRVRMHGATPPHVYRMKMREALFHGVEAIRLLPLGGEDAIYGRDGILAHTYMLGPSGQSNGCVSFKSYQAFLRAFKDGKIDRLAVIAKID